MPRILIADDNSNIQRMAALALKDAGIEVVAVGNGEAAVRKLAEISPDLVLADIFMPVRSGYEVCEFIKHDPKFSNIPVLLLAGAFDPFDEREAQRVQADGILKKPFVPPDPLINAVKALLEKTANEKLMAVAVPAAAEASVRANGTAANSALSSNAVAEPPAHAVADAEGKAYDEPLSVVDFVSGPKKDAAKPKATPFESAVSFEIPAADEPEPVVTASRDPVLGEPAFWVPEETATEQASSAEESVEDLTDHSWSSLARPAPILEEPDPPMMLELEPPKAEAAIHDFDLTDVAPVTPEPAQIVEGEAKENSNEFVAPELPELESFTPPAPISNAISRVVSDFFKQPAALLAPAVASPYATKTSTEDTLPLPERTVQPVESKPEPLQDAASSATEPATPETETPHISEIPLIAEASHAVTSAASVEPTRSPAIPAVEDEDSTLLELEDSLAAFSDISSPAPVHVSSQAEPQEPVEEHSVSKFDIAGKWPPAFVPVTVPGANETQGVTKESVSGQPKSVTPIPVGREAIADPAPEPANLASLSPEAQEAVIQRVIERMQPQIVEMVTRQILRPLVESLVRHELGK